jgi:hypothetical protein
MGHDPQADWLTPPFYRDRNTLLVAAEGGFGTVDLDVIDFLSEVQAPVGEFFAKETKKEMIFIGGGAGMAPMRSHIFDQLVPDAL